MRSQYHLKDYRAHKDSSALWRHTRDYHGGILGPDRGLMDYRMTQLEVWPKPLDRLSGEGVLIQELEELQHTKQAQCMNYKLDFKQTHSVTMAFNSGSNT